MSRDYRRSGLAAIWLMTLLVTSLALPSFAAPELADAVEEALAEAVAEADDSGGDGDDNGQEDEAPVAAPRPSGLSGALSKLSVHGFLTQAYAESNFVDIPVGPLPPPPLGRPCTSTTTAPTSTGSACISFRISHPRNRCGNARSCQL